MISRISIRNFKCLRDVHVGLERFTVFVGPNASGKSSILQALDYLCRTFQIDRPEQIDGDLLQSLSRGADPMIELAAESNGRAYRYCPRNSSTPRPQRRTPHEKWDRNGRGFASSLIESDWKYWGQEPPRKSPLPLSVLLHLEASKLVLPNPARDDSTVMSADGTGLHSALASMALNDPDSWQSLQENIRRIIPTIRRLRHTPSKPNQHPALLFDTVGADSLPAHQVSEGTLLVLGLLAAVHATGRPSLMLLDDLDRGLHPKAQKELIMLLRGLLNTHPDLQIVATTHSPYMLDCMETNEVRMTFLGDDGATVCAALTSHPEFPKWKDEMTPGEMWSLFGEKWLVKQGAAA